MGSKFVTFGEIMLRLTAPSNSRFAQVNNFNVTFGGGEANVAVSLSNYGLKTEYITSLPANDIGDFCLQSLRAQNVGLNYVARRGERIGVYFLETGAVQRGSKVIYDRGNSAFATIKPGMFNWKAIFSDAAWFHWTGISPAVSESAAEVCLEALKVAKEMGVTVSCDLNYRNKLWKWGSQPAEVMTELVKYVDLAIGNEEDAEKVFGIKASNTDIVAGKLDGEKYQKVCEDLVEKFPNLKKVAITLRGSVSASHNTWSACLWDDGEFYRGPNYDITHIVDRVGGGDSFGGGLIYGLNTYDDPQQALDFAVAASCLKHSIYGDFNRVTVAEVEKLMSGDASGRVTR